MPPPPEPALRALQLRVMDALLGGALEEAAPLVAAAPASATGSLAVYRNNVLGNFHDGLASSFPAVQRLVGKDYFAQTAREFQRLHPSRSGDLLPAGTLFPDYLADLHTGSPFAYLAEVARLEWLIQECLLAAGHAPFELTRLAAVDPGDYDALRFVLHPSLRLFESPFPALRIWETNVGPGVDAHSEPEAIDLDSGADRLALLCVRLTLDALRLDPGEAAFLEALRGEACFADAVEAGVVAAGVPGAGCFDATAALQRFVVAGAIVDCR